MKITLKFLIITVLIVFFYKISEGGGPSGYVKTLDPSVKDKLIVSLRQINILHGTEDYQIENAIIEYLFKNKTLLKTNLIDIPMDRLVDTTICIMMYNRHFEFEQNFYDGRCNSLIKIP